MRRMQVAAALGIAAILMWVPGRAQNGANTTRSKSLPQVSPANSTSWPLHSLDLHSTRYSALNQITPANVGTLQLKWTFDPKVGIPQVTPLVIDGVMYFNAGSKLFAVNAVTGESVWTLTFRLAKVRIRGEFDAYNIFNGSGILGINATYGANWLRPRRCG